MTTAATKSADITNLANSAQWLKLGHYQRDWIGQSFTSEVDDDRFFLAAEGKHNPEAELMATIDALTVTIAQNDYSVFCRFPARAFWLYQQLPEVISDYPIAQCVELREWQQKVPADSISLIFPASYINSPSSMFGHTLLRIDPPKNANVNALLSWALNYGANTDGLDGGIAYAIKGLTGGYYGTYSLVPYFEKVKEYNDIDNRDIFEYKLNLTHQEIQFLLLHAWELKGIQFQYFYFDENCAYQLLTLLEVVRPEAPLTKQFTISAIPADTVRSIWQAGFIESTTLRPSAKTEFNAFASELSDSDKVLVRQLVFDFEQGIQNIATVSVDHQIMLLKQAYRYSRLLAVEEDKNEQVKQASYAILREVSTRPTYEETMPEVTVDRTELGHYSKRWGFSGYYSSATPKQQGAILSYRPAYHDWLDPLPGYAAGANIELLDTQIYFDDESVELHKLSVAQVQALRKVDAFFNPTSWYAGGGFERKPLRENKLDGYIHTGRGRAFGGVNHLFYGFVAARYETHNGLMPGARLGWLYQGGFSWHLEGHSYYSFVRDLPEHSLRSELRLHMGNQFSIQLLYQWQSNNRFDEETFSAGVFHFF